MEPAAEQVKTVVEVCLLAGKIILQSGGETYRVEDTMTRIAAALGVLESHSFVMPTGILFSIDGSAEGAARLVRISQRSTDLSKVTQVNAISREISGGRLNAEEALRRLKEIEKAGLSYPFPIQVLAAALVSGGFLLMSRGGWHDVIPSCVAGGIGYSCSYLMRRVVPIKFFAEFLAALVIGLIASGLVRSGAGQQIDLIIIGSVMPLVPGLLITNAVRDLMAGHLVSGLSKGAEAFLTAFAIGAGIAFVLSMLK